MSTSNNVLALPAPNEGSPVVLLRELANLSQDAFAKLLMLNPQTLYQAECGQFPDLPATIIHAAAKYHPNPQNFRKEYRLFVHDKRLRLRTALEDASVVWTLEDDARKPPIEGLVACSGLTLSQFSKQAAILPATLYRLRKGQLKSLGASLEEALLEIGVPQALLEELNSRQEEFYYMLKRAS